jgi:hypothetical protein
VLRSAAAAIKMDSFEGSRSSNSIDLTSSVEGTNVRPCSASFEKPDISKEYDWFLCKFYVKKLIAVYLKIEALVIGKTGLK